MKSNSPRLADAVRSSSLLVSLYVLESSALLSCMAIYKRGDRSLLGFLSTHAGLVFILAALVAASSIFFIIRLIRKDLLAGSKQFGLTLALNLFSVVFVVATAEVIVRLFSVSTPAGPMFANTLLLPRSWESFAAHQRAILAKASTWGSYFVYDSFLGWTVGRSRRGQDGLYFSSVEGIRSPRVGMALASIPVKHRVAIVGDSFTFGLEVPYEDTWGHQLELMLGPEFRVLNFGVDGYGVDQAYLRYQRDVTPWRPEIVILGVINDDLIRTMGVYGFLKFLEWEMPFPKPRFVIRGNALTPLNLPLPTPELIFASRSIHDLPFIDYDPSYQRGEWEWRFYDYLYSIRFLLSRYPRWQVVRPAISGEAMKALNGEILRSFVRLADQEGSTPIVVYFPSRPDFETSTSSGEITNVAKGVLEANHIPYLDMTDCVSKVRPTERFITGHYSPATNAAVAGCLRSSIREASQSRTVPN
jgi:hypothetical protein